MALAMNDACLKLSGWFYEAFTLLANVQPNLPVSDAFTFIVSNMFMNKVLRIYVPEGNMEFLFEKYVSHMRHLFDKTPIWNAYLIVRIYLSPGIHLAIAIQSASQSNRQVQLYFLGQIHFCISTFVLGHKRFWYTRGKVRFTGGIH